MTTATQKAMTERVLVRMTPEDKALLEEEAARVRIKPSAFLRSLMVRSLEEIRKKDGRAP